MTVRAITGRGGATLVRRVGVLVTLVVLFVLAGAGTGWALWSTSEELPARTILAKVDLELVSSSPRAVDYVAVGDSSTTAITIVNGSTVAVDYTLSARAGTAGAVSTALARDVTVQLWSEAVSSCSSSVPGGALSGTWASPPAAVGSMPRSSRATWCWRATVGPDAADGATVNPIFAVDGGSHGWTDWASLENFYQNTRFVPVAGELSCRTEETGDGTSYVTVSWPAPLDADQWGVFVAGTRVGSTVSGQASPKEHVVTRDMVPVETVPDGPVVVDVRSVAGAQPGPVAWTGTVVAAPNERGQRQISCR